MQNVKAEFESHLASIGYEPRVGRDIILQKLRQRMGEERFREICGKINGPRSAGSQEEFYGNFRDLIEGNLMRSLDPSVTLDASYELYIHAAPRFGRGTRVLELGCWTGGLASFIAQRHADCQVNGVDGAQKIVDSCTAHYKLPNLGFLTWNYRWSKPEALEPADILLCSMGVVHHSPDNTELPDPGSVRKCREYVIQRDHALGYFGQWRTAAKEGAMLYAVLRLRLFPRLLAWIDAAHASGWTAHLDGLWRVNLPGEGSIMPGLVFEARESKQLPEEVVLERFAWFNHGEDIYAHLQDAEALAAFRVIAAKENLASRKYHNRGLLTCDEVGMTGGVGYVFTHDAVSKYRLLFVSPRRAKQLAAGISSPGSKTPIGDDGAFVAASIVKPQQSANRISPFFSGGSVFKVS